MKAPILKLHHYPLLVVVLLALVLALVATYRERAEDGPLCDVENAEQCSCKIPEPPHEQLPWRKS